MDPNFEVQFSTPLQLEDAYSQALETQETLPGASFHNTKERSEMSRMRARSAGR